MMKKGAQPIVARHVIWLSWKLVVLLSVALCALALLRLHSHSDLSSSSSSRLRPRIYRPKFEGTPKIAFLFLARRNLPLDFLWDSFFEVFLPLFFFLLFFLIFFKFCSNFRTMNWLGFEGFMRFGASVELAGC
jgi:hypothetical protein